MRERRDVATACLVLAVTLGVQAAEAGDEDWTASGERRARVIRQVQGASARTIDGSLPAMPLERWLRRTLGVTAMVEWSVGGCDLVDVPEAMQRGYPRCVEVNARRADQVDVRLHLLVGTHKGVATGAPVVFNTSFVMKGIKSGCIRGVEHLSDIPREIDALQADGCQPGVGG
jgi:hypothetical protein